MMLISIVKIRTILGMCEYENYHFRGKYGDYAGSRWDDWERAVGFAGHNVEIALLTQT